MKEAFRLTTKTLAGETPVSSNEPRVSARRGLPLIIPGSLRLLIERRDPYIIKGVLTILSVYRILPAHPELKLETITSPFKGKYQTSPEIVSTMEILKPFLPKEKSINILGDKSLISPGVRILPITSSGPNTKLSLWGYLEDAKAFSENPKLLEAFGNVSKILGKDIYKTLLSDIKMIKDLNYETPIELLKEGPRTLGRLAMKMEPAGKVRIFAIVDGWTQSILRPLHDFLFDVLRNIPQDGTFDQYAPLSRLVKKGLPFLGSYDLSAATDRLPISLQKDILRTLFGDLFAESWAYLLVGRSYLFKGERYTYSVGQPMGALSSWAMLALTHHLIIQTAAQRTGRFTG